MKEKILKALKTRFAKYGLSDKVLEGAAALIEPSVTYEEDIDKVIPDYEPMLKAMQSELDTVRSQKSELETKIKSLSVKPHEKGGTEDETKEKDVNATQTPDWAKAIIESNKQLAERLNGIEGQKLVDKRKREIETIVEKLPETLRRPYQRLSVDGMTDEQFTKLSADIEQEVSEIAKQATAKGSIFTPPSAAQTAATDSEKKEIDEVVSSVVENNKII